MAVRAAGEGQWFRHMANYCKHSVCGLRHGDTCAPRIDGTRHAATRAMRTMALSLDELQVLGTAETPGTETAQFRRDRMTSLTQTSSINTCVLSPDNVLGEKDESKHNADGADREVGASQEVLRMHDTPPQHDQHQSTRAHVLATNPARGTDYDALPASKHIDREAAVDSDLIPVNAQVRGGGGYTAKLTFQPSTRCRCERRASCENTNQASTGMRHGSNRAADLNVGKAAVRIHTMRASSVGLLESELLRRRRGFTQLWRTCASSCRSAPVAVLAKETGCRCRTLPSHQQFVSGW
jgi:hypothetical protein